MQVEEDIFGLRQEPKEKHRPATHHISQWGWLAVGLILADTLALACAFSVAYLIRFKTGIPYFDIPPYSLRFYSTIVFLSLPLWIIVFAVFRLYSLRYLLGGIQEYVRLINACTVGTLAVVVASFLEPDLWISRGWLLLAWLLAIMAVAIDRFTARRLVYWLRKRGRFMAPTIIVGANEEGQALAEQLLGVPTSGLKVLGFVDDRFPPGTHVLNGLHVLGSLADLERLVEEQRVVELVLASTALPRQRLLSLYRTFGASEQVHVQMSSGLFEMLTTGVRVREVGGVPLIIPEKVRITGVDAVLKALEDYMGAFLGLLLLTPLFLVLALLIRLDSPGPVFFRRRVLGRGGKPFDALKFRTMVANADDVLARQPSLRKAFEKEFKLKEDPRVTRAGAFLRKTSLDELPQLINVLLGQMSLVGPRMVAVDEGTKYGKWRMNLLTVKPGITGPWQVKGRNNLSYEERIKLSMYYIRNYTIWLDLQILLQTVPAVLNRRGAY